MHVPIFLNVLILIYCVQFYTLRFGGHSKSRNGKWEMGNEEMEQQHTVGVKKDSGVYCCANAVINYIEEVGLLSASSEKEGRRWQ